MLNVLRFITSHCNETNVSNCTVSSVPEIPTSGPAKGLHGLDSHSGVSVAAVINVHECRSCVITAHARSPGLSVCHSSVSPLYFAIELVFLRRRPVTHQFIHVRNVELDFADDHIPIFSPRDAETWLAVYPIMHESSSRRATNRPMSSASNHSATNTPFVARGQCAVSREDKRSSNAIEIADRCLHSAARRRDVTYTYTHTRAHNRRPLAGR